MTVGIKYCGGCNPLYDSGYLISELKRQFLDHEYRYIRRELEADTSVGEDNISVCF